DAHARRRARGRQRHDQEPPGSVPHIHVANTTTMSRKLHTPNRRRAFVHRPLRIAIVYPGNQETRRDATRENNRFAALFAVLVDTREMGWGSDVHRIDTPEQLGRALGARLASGAARVLKQWRGHSGIGVWRVQRAQGAGAVGPDTLVDARHAQRGSVETRMS